MTIFLPTIRPQHTLLTKIGILLFNWIAWIVPAWADAVADDMGDTYQHGLVLLLSFWGAVTITFALFGVNYFEFGILTMVGIEGCMYLFFGLLYHWYEHT